MGERRFPGLARTDEGDYPAAAQGIFNEAAELKALDHLGTLP